MERSEKFNITVEKEVYKLKAKQKMMERPALDKQLDSKAFRDFFADNLGKTLENAISCWKTKRDCQGIIIIY